MFLRDLTWGVVGLLASTAIAWADPVGQVIKLSGNATVTRENATAPLVLGAALEPGDLLATDASGRVRLQLIDGSIINLGSQSEFSIDSVMSSDPAMGRQVSLDLLNGALRAFAAPATPKSRFEIRTPNAITAVRGTEWGILTGQQQSDVLVLSGRVGVRKNEISGQSAISLTQSLGVTVTDAGLGQITRWPQARVDALVSATDVPGAEIPFDLGTAPSLDMTPLPPEALPENPNLPHRRTQRCLDPDASVCTRGDQGGRSGGRDNSRDHGNGSSGGSSGSAGSGSI